jgi:ribosomal protein S8
MEDRVLDRLVTLGFIKKYKYTQEVPLPEDDDLEKEVLVLYLKATKNISESNVITSVQKLQYPMA